MSKKLTFSVELEFNNKVTSDEDIMAIAQNIALSLKHTCDTAGLVPDGSDNYTEIIRVTPQYLDETVIEQVI